MKALKVNHLRKLLTTSQMSRVSALEVCKWVQLMKFSVTAPLSGLISPRIHHPLIMVLSLCRPFLQVQAEKLWGGDLLLTYQDIGLAADALSESR